MRSVLRRRAATIGRVPDLNERDRSTAPASTFEQTVTELSKRHQLGCSVRLLENSTAYAEARPGRRIRVTSALLEESDEEQAWSAAHEVGHVVSARERGLAFYPWGFLGCVGVTAALAGPVPGVVLGLLRPALPAAGWARTSVILSTMVLCWLLAALSSHFALLARARHQLPLEQEADQFAADEGHPVTPAIVAMLSRHETPTRWSAALARYRTHPLPEHRLRKELLPE